jgi:capsular polysaccharide biosynthesis protein
VGVDLSQRGTSATRPAPAVSPTSPADDARRVLAAVRRRWLTVVDVLLVTLVALFVFSHVGPGRYDATAQILLQQPDQVNAVLNPDAITSAANVQREVNTNAQLITSSPVVDAVREKLGLAGTTRDLSARLSVTGEATSNLVEITASDSRPDVAARIATAVAQQYQAYRRRSAQDAIGSAVTAARARLRGMDNATRSSAEGQALEARLHQLETGAAVATGGVQVVRPAAVPSSAVPRVTPLSIAVAIVLALALAALGVIVVERLDRRLFDDAAVEDAFGVPVIARIPPAQRGGRHDRARTAAFEALAGRLRFATSGVAGRVLMVAPAVRDFDDDSPIRLVESLADVDPCVLLIEADLRLGGRDPAAEGGLADVLCGGATVEDEIVVVSEDGEEGAAGRTWELLAGGRRISRPASLLGGPEMAAVLDAARARADDVVVAGPPLTSPAATLGLAAQCDALLVVVRERTTTYAEARAARSTLAATATPVLGVVLVREPSRRWRPTGPRRRLSSRRPSARHEAA